MSVSGFQTGDSVVVTGAAQGIGRAVAVALSQRGARLVLWDISAEGLAETEALCAANGASCFVQQVDVGDPARIASAAAEAIARQGSIFGLVNNAGIFPRVAIRDVTPDVWRQVLGVNLMGTVFCSQAFGAHMADQGRGAVVNMASGRALQGTPRGAHYAASKAGIVSFTKSFALEYADAGLRCNAVIPGVTETAQPLADSTLEELHSRGKRIPLGRIGQPEDIAKVVCFLLSEDAAYMTGQSVPVNGGAIMVP
ncbi:MAG: 3-oxoacyl-[acyl-carrier protein] reductase [Hyphomicrobiales bacterium]|nr:3-oxoacyl-[acyl-carrier protein] reductase [Hyphomicrobiales bacterium]